MLRSLRKLVAVATVLAIIATVGWLAVELSPYSPRSLAYEAAKIVLEHRRLAVEALRKHSPFGEDHTAWLESLPEDGSTWQSIWQTIEASRDSVESDPDCSRLMGLVNLVGLRNFPHLPVQDFYQNASDRLEQSYGALDGIELPDAIIIGPSRVDPDADSSNMMRVGRDLFFPFGLRALLLLKLGHEEQGKRVLDWTIKAGLRLQPTISWESMVVGALRSQNAAVLLGLLEAGLINQEYASILAEEATEYPPHLAHVLLGDTYRALSVTPNDLHAVVHSDLMPHFSYFGRSEFTAWKNGLDDDFRMKRYLVAINPQSTTARALSGGVGLSRQELLQAIDWHHGIQNNWRCASSEYAHWWLNSSRFNPVQADHERNRDVSNGGWDSFRLTSRLGDKEITSRQLFGDPPQTLVKYRISVITTPQDGNAFPASCALLPVEMTTTVQPQRPSSWYTSRGIPKPEKAFQFKYLGMDNPGELKLVENPHILSDDDAREAIIAWFVHDFSVKPYRRE